MTLLKTSALSAIASVIRILNGLIITKVIAVYVGPSGLALIGQLQNFINIMLLFSGDFLKTATTKYTAEYIDDEQKKYTLWSTQIKIVFFLNIIIFSILFFFADSISSYLLKSTEFSYILKVLAFSLPFFVFNTMILSILNGHKQIKKYIALSIASSVVSLVIVVVLSIYYGLSGALIAYTINQSVVFFIALYFTKDEEWFKVSNFRHAMNSEDVKKLMGFALITLVAILSSNLTLMYIRNYISVNLSLEDAGYWQGIWSLSQVSLSLITTSLVTYFLPTLSGLKDKQKISKELKNAIKLILPIAFAISMSMYFLRDLIIHLLYTEEFQAMEELFLWQMIGNTIKVAGWLFGYVLVAKAMVKYTVTTEIIFAILFIVLSIICINQFGLVGVTYAFTINSFLHFVTMFLIYKYKVI
ncbi:MAG: Lipid III flippase [uncultured Sulfurimonas sp.]|nr:MAG: Lipid III flippase [uncultured Sulfurimonas sp.]